MHSEEICSNCSRKDIPLEPIWITSEPEDLEEVLDREEEGQLYLCVSCHADLMDGYNEDAVYQERFMELSKKK